MSSETEIAQTLLKLCKNYDTRGNKDCERLPLQGPEGWRNPVRARCSFLLQRRWQITHSKRPVEGFSAESYVEK